MTLLVVDALEMIDVAHDDRQGIGIAAAAFDLAWQLLHQIAPIEGAGQRVGDGQDAVALIGRAQRVFQIEDAAAGIETRDEFGLMHRLGEVIVGTGLQPGNDVLLAIARRQQQRVHIAVELHVAHRLAQP